MRKSLSFLVITLLAMSLTANAAVAATSTQSAPAASGVVNINTADASQISMLPRIGAKVAQRVVDYRKEHGPFKTTTDLMQVKGIGQKSYDRLSAYLTVDGKTTLAAKVASPHKPRSTKHASTPAR